MAQNLEICAKCAWQDEEGFGIKSTEDMLVLLSKFYYFSPKKECSAQFSKMLDMRFYSIIGLQRNEVGRW